MRQAAVQAGFIRGGEDDEVTFVGDNALSVEVF